LAALPLLVSFSLGACHSESCFSHEKGWSNRCPGAPGVDTTSTPVVAAGDTYVTSFPRAENPLSDSGRWINGGDAGLDWQNVRTVPGKAFATDFAAGYNDDIAVLSTSLSPNQFAQGTVSRAADYNAAVKHEIELLLRFRIEPHRARGYEILWGMNGEIYIVRWNGPLNSYTALAGRANMGPAREGDRLRAEVFGPMIRVYRNGSLVLMASDSTWKDGQPGMGFWPKPGATIDAYGWTDYQAGSLAPLGAPAGNEAAKQPKP
jgi:hypothetical protein